MQAPPPSSTCHRHRLLRMAPATASRYCCTGLLSISQRSPARGPLRTTRRTSCHRPAPPPPVAHWGGPPSSTSPLPPLHRHRHRPPAVRTRMMSSSETPITRASARTRTPIVPIRRPPGRPSPRRSDRGPRRHSRHPESLSPAPGMMTPSPTTAMKRTPRVRPAAAMATVMAIPPRSLTRASLNAALNCRRVILQMGADLFESTKCIVHSFVKK